MTESLEYPIFKDIISYMTKSELKEFVRYLIDEDLEHVIFNKGGK